MASAPLRLFPTVSTDVPRKPSLQKPRSSHAKRSANGLKGVAVRITADMKSQANPVPALESVQHSLFCDPSTETSPTTTTNSSKSPSSSAETVSRRKLDRETHFQIRSDGFARSPPNVDRPAVASNYETSPIQEDATSIEARSLPKRHASRVKRSLVPNTIQTRSIPHPVPHDIPKGDQLSPLPEKTHFTPRAVRPVQSHSAMSRKLSHSSRTESASSSPALSGQPCRDTPPMRSMFPQYDHSKSLNQQPYYPRTQHQTPPSMTREKVSKLGSPAEKQTMERFEPRVGFVDGYENVPAAGLPDMHDIWTASCEEVPVIGRKVQLTLHQFSGRGTALAVGRTSQELLYSMDRIDTQAIQQNPSQAKEMAVRKHHPTQRTSFPVAHLMLPERALIGSTDKTLTSIFPQAAAIDAIEALISKPTAKMVSSLDASMHSPAAARFAHEAIAAAQQQYSCDLVRKARRRDSLGSVTAAYNLRHPRLGSFTINVTKSYAPISPTVPRAKISLHHPSATPTAIAAESLNLAFLDFARDSCVLDLPGLLALDDHYVVDTVVAALLAVAVIENDALIAEALVFDAPPKVPFSAQGGKDSRASNQKKEKGEQRSSFRRRGRKGKKQKKHDNEIVGEQVELPMLTQGALALLGLSVKAAVLLLNTGAKVTAGVVVGLSNATRKL